MTRLKRLFFCGNKTCAIYALFWLVFSFLVSLVLEPGTGYLQFGCLFFPHANYSYVGFQDSNKKGTTTYNEVTSSVVKYTNVTQTLVCESALFCHSNNCIKNASVYCFFSFYLLGFCPEFRYIRNGQVIHVSPKVGNAAVEFHCNNNYRLTGRTRLECINGRWNGKIPFCESE